MRVLAPLLLGAMPAALAQNAQWIVYGLQGVQGEIRQLDGRVQSFTGAPVVGVSDVVRIQTQNERLARAIETCSSYATDSPVLDARGSEAVTAAVIALRTDLEGLLQNLQVKKPVFDRVFVGLASVSRQVMANLEHQKALTVGLAHSITKKLTGAYRESAPGIVEEFKDAFDEAIAAYVVSNSPQLPALPIPGLAP